MDERIGFWADRLRLGEWVIGFASLALILDVLLLPWFSLKSTSGLGPITNPTGISSDHVLGAFALICGVLGLAVWGLQATSRGPALPVAVTVITWALSFVLIVGLLIRVVLDPPDGAHGANAVQTDVAAVIGIFLAVILFAGTWMSLRADGINRRDAPRRIETLRLARRSA